MSLSLSEVKDFCVQEIRSEGADWYKGTRMKYKCFSRFKDIEETIVFLNDPCFQNKEDYVLKDRLLHTLIIEFQTNRNISLLRSIFIVTFYPLLSRLIYPFLNKNLVNDEIVGEAICALLKVIHAFNFTYRQKSLSRSIVRNTRRQFWYWVNREIKYLNLCTGIDEPPSYSVSPPKENPLNLDDILKFLGALKTKGVIGGLEHHLLVGTRVYGQQLKELVANPRKELGGIGYEAAKKRIQRAEQKIKKYLSNNELSLDDQKK